MTTIFTPIKERQATHVRPTRFSIRQIMVAVAAVALTLAIRIEIDRIRVRSMDYQLRSLDHSLAAMRYEGRNLASCRGRPEPRRSFRNPSKAAYHAAMSRKWSEAAEHASLPVGPDPPAPYL